MTNTKSKSPPAPPHDYRAAVQDALSWLGNRYLLAEPLNRRRESGDQRGSQPGNFSYSR